MPYFRVNLSAFVVPDFTKPGWDSFVQRHCVKAIEAFEADIRRQYDGAGSLWREFMVKAASREDAVNAIIDTKVIAPYFARKIQLKDAMVVLDPVTPKEWIPDPNDPTGRISRRTVRIKHADGKSVGCPVRFDWSPNASKCELEGWLGVEVHTQECVGVA